MLLVDSEIRTFLTNGKIAGTELAEAKQTAIAHGDEDCITNIGYDLRAARFAKNGKFFTDGCELNPGDSVFVESVEAIRFDNNTVGKLALKNSRIRMGFTMDAPTYQPGHTTKIYFRLTNVSNDVLSLVAGDKYAMLMFEQLNTAPDKPYNGPFEKEFSFNGLGAYKSKYADQIRTIDNKIEDLKSLEKNVYGNMLTILSIFVAIFSLLNVNISLTSQAASQISFLVFNLATLGAISLLALFLNALINKESKPSKLLWLVPGVCFGVVLGISLMSGGPVPSI